jgi:curved DNA-binding protein
MSAYGMQVNKRRAQRKSLQRKYSISWKDENGLTHSADIQGMDVCGSGVGLRCPFEIPTGAVLYIQAEDGTPKGYGIVRHLERRGDFCHIGVEFDESYGKMPSSLDLENTPDYYEFLQISPNAQPDTVHRVYRFLASRYHPDIPETGDSEKFLLLNCAYEVLSEPTRRAQYDELLRTRPARRDEIFEFVDFLDGVEGELNRRLAVLSLLYRKCRGNIQSPSISLLDLEAHMGFPREYLDFTIWYLRHKKYICQDDGAALALTSSGVDYVEANYSKLPLLDKLLNGSYREASATEAKSANPKRTSASFALGSVESVQGSADR